jgi:hypothetical protein
MATGFDAVESRVGCDPLIQTDAMPGSAFRRQSALLPRSLSGRPGNEDACDIGAQFLDSNTRKTPTRVRSPDRRQSAIGNRQSAIDREGGDMLTRRQITLPELYYIL